MANVLELGLERVLRDDGGLGDGLVALVGEHPGELLRGLFCAEHSRMP